jgi:hypothetical protein
MFRWLHRSKLLAVLAGLLLVAGLASAPPAAATYPTSPTMYVFGSNSSCNGNCSFYPGEFTLYSSNGRDKLAFGLSGNFAGYDSAGRQWFQSGTAGTGHELRLQTDGNIVVYDDGPQHDFIGQQALWAAGVHCCFHWYRITTGGDGHWSLWGGYSTTNWLRLDSYGNGA